MISLFYICMHLVNFIGFCLFVCLLVCLFLFFLLVTKVFDKHLRIKNSEIYRLLHVKSLISFLFMSF